jgi:amino acid adenylation domain-containing protein
MNDLHQRLASLSPEKRRLAELMLREKWSRERSAVAGGTLPSSTDSQDGAFSLLAEEDHRKLPDGLEDAYPLAMLQLGMIYHMEMTLDHPIPAYHNVNSFHVEAPFVREALQQAVDTVVARHATLRTSFHLEGYSEPLQLVHRSVKVDIEVEDLRHLSRAEQQELLDRFFETENRRIFDLSRPPLLRFHVHLRNDRRFQFTLTEPHVISEGWSTTSTLAEIADLYLALVEGRALPEPSASLPPYREFVRLERETLASQEAQAFWRERLDGWVTTRLSRWPAGFHPAGRAKNRKPTYELPADLLADVQRLARTAGVPIKSVLLAAHFKVMSLWSGESRVAIGLEFHGRPEVREGDQSRGVFINTLPARCELGRLSWTELIRRAFEVETEILPFRRFPLAALQKGRQAPLFEVSFTYLHFHGVDRVFQSERMILFRPGISDLSVSNFPLAATFHMAEGSANVLTLILEYDDQEFPIQQIRAFQRSYEQVLRAMVRNPAAVHDEIPLLGPLDRHHVLIEWNDTAFRDDTLIHRRIERWARESPGEVAVEQDGQFLTYGELDRRAAALARRLRALGVRADSLVGLYIERSCDMIVGLLGILKAGGAYLPLDPSYPQQRLRFLLEDAGISLLVIRKPSPDLAAPAGARTVPLEGMFDNTVEEPADLAPEPAPDNLAYVIYTSGSTGQPKGVMVTHANLAVSTAARIRYYRTRVTSYLLLSSVAFDSSVAGIFWTLCDGGTLVLPPQDAERDPQEVARIAAARNPSHLLTLPSVYSLLLDEDGGRPLAGLRVAIACGDVFPPELVAKHHELLPHTVLFSEYGPTEGTIWCSAFELTAPLRGNRVPLGQPISGARLYVLDEGMQPVPVGAPGEIWLGGAGLTRGYLRQPDLTASRFAPDPFIAEPGARMYRSGDVGRWLPDGNLEFLGRKDHQVKVRGFRVELQEVESVLARHPGVREVAAIVREDVAGRPRLVAYVVGREGNPPSSTELRSFLRQQLPEYMVPSFFISLERMPTTPNGKVDRAALPAPSEDRPESDREYVPPRDATEEALAAVWREALGIATVGIYDNFFELGGTSLLLVQAHRRQRAALGTSLALADFFQNPTIAGLAEIVRRGQQGNVTAPGHTRAGARKTSAEQVARARELRRNSRR